VDRWWRTTVASLVHSLNDCQAAPEVKQIQITPIFFCMNVLRLDFGKLLSSAVTKQSLISMNLNYDVLTPAHAPCSTPSYINLIPKHTCQEALLLTICQHCND
jgi:hypothetical protein